MPKDLIKEIHGHGALFSFLFYIITGFAIVQLVAALIASIVVKSTIGMIFSSSILGLIIFFLAIKSISWALTTVTAFTPFTFILLATLPLMQSLAHLPVSSAYIAIPIHALLLGWLVAFMFDKVDKSFLAYAYSSIKFSVFLAIIFSVNTFVSKLDGGTKFADVTSAFAEFAIVFSPNHINPIIGFLIALVCFNIPFFLYYGMREQWKKSVLWLYLIPLLVFAFASTILEVLSRFL